MQQNQAQMQQQQTQAPINQSNQQQLPQQYRSLTPRAQTLDINIRKDRNISPGPRYRDNLQIGITKAEIITIKIETTIIEIGTEAIREEDKIIATTIIEDQVNKEEDNGLQDMITTTINAKISTTI